MTPAVERFAKRFSLELLKRQSQEKLHWLFYGETGGGKSQQMLGLVQRLPGLRMLVLTFDGQTQAIADGMFGGDPNIYVIDGMALYNAQPERFNVSGAESIEFIEAALEAAVSTFHPHIIAFDGLEKMNRLGEGKMRFLHGLKPSEGFREISFWKDRTLAIDAIIRKAEGLATLGCAYTVYYDKQYGDEGSTDTRAKTPKYIDAIHGRMTFVIECRSQYNSLTKSNRYTAYVQFARANHKDILVTGTTHDVTWDYTPDTRSWVPHGLPWGPRLDTLYARAEARLKGVTIVYPESTDLLSEEIRSTHTYLPLGGIAEPSPYIRREPAVGAEATSPSSNTVFFVPPTTPKPTPRGELEL